MTDISQSLRFLGEPYTRADKIKSVIERAARRAGLSYWRAFDIWYGKARRISDEERQQISAALEQKREQDARHEFHDLKVRLLRLEARLVQTDAEFHRETITAIGQSVRRPR